jgi:hypothetical protein
MNIMLVSVTGALAKSAFEAIGAAQRHHLNF